MKKNCGNCAHGETQIFCTMDGHYYAPDDESENKAYQCFDPKAQSTRLILKAMLEDIKSDKRRKQYRRQLKDMGVL